MANVTAFRRLLAFPLSIHRLQHTNQSPGSPTRTPAWVSIRNPASEPDGVNDHRTFSEEVPVDALVG